MNTVGKGDEFEKKSYDLIISAINDNRFGMAPEYSRVFQKKKYFSHLRQRDIIFDLSIEIWPPNAERYSVLYLIECKNYATKTVPVDDVEEFINKLQQVAGMGGHFIKGAMIANGTFSEGALTIAKNTHLMLMEVGAENALSIKLHKTERPRNQLGTNPEIKAEQTLETFVRRVFSEPKVKGLRLLSKSMIWRIANDILLEVDNNILTQASPTPVEQVIKYFKDHYSLECNFDVELPSVNGTKLYGLFDSEKNLIQIDKDLSGTDRFAFAFGHELGHFVLHRKLELNQQLYNDFQDSEYGLLEDRHLFKNFKHWIEWQANCFGAAFIVPAESLKAQLIAKQRHLGISKTGHIFLDNQQVNQSDYREILTYLTEHFNTTRTTIIYKLEELGLITYHRSKEVFKTELRNIYRGIKINKVSDKSEELGDAPF